MNASKYDYWKFWCFSVVVAGFLILCLEVGARIFYYQSHARYPLALQGTIVTVKNRVRKVEATLQVNRTVNQLHKLGLQVNEEQGFAPQEAVRLKLVEGLYSAQGATVLNKFRREYEEVFAEFVREAESIHTRICVLYIPPIYAGSELHNRQFYRELVQKYHVDYVDCTEEMQMYPADWVTLLPEDAHLSRLGNQVVAQTVSAYIDRYTDYQSSVTFVERPAKFGDLNPKYDNKIWDMLPQLPFQVTSNSQGLRMDYELTFPKQKQRILILGDSFTFGSYLPNVHCYPNLLDTHYPEKEVINAGIGGYTITDEASLFIEKAKYVEPDITILQVLENDIPGLFYFMKNQFDRKNRVFTPSPEEVEFIKSLTSS